MQQTTLMTFSAIGAQQSAEHTALTFAASAAEILAFSSIHRIGRDEQGELSGFQRPQVAAHIREIRDYLEKPNSVLPNPVVVAFTEGVEVEALGGGLHRLSIDVSKGPCGLVVDGQQRLSALAEVNRDFQVFVSALICRDDAELRRQFVLINNTRPLPKSLIYELLPSVDDLPPRLGKRALASEITARLNFKSTSSLRGLIKLHTSPDGVIADTAIQRVVMDSLADGVLRSLVRAPEGKEACVDLVSAFYKAVFRAFPGEWHGHTAATSRLRHGAGILAMGAVMDILAQRTSARTDDEFLEGLQCLKGHTAWTEGEWEFGSETRRWNSLQNVNRDITLLTHHLTTIVKADLRNKRRAAPLPLLEQAVG